MAWNHLDVDKPHLAYMILGGFTGLFMLCSLFVKEKLYIGEATVATICGIIFGPNAANLFDPRSWGNVDKITLECSRIVLVVQCFAIGVELPKAYMERHWKSVTLLLVPVMTWGWLVTSLFIWWMVPTLNWLESLVCAACVTATDPVLASSVVGKGKFAKRVPKHLRDLLSAESGCNDGMAFPFIYLSFYILQYRPDAGKISLNWFCVTILYECIFGAFYGFMIGYGARHAIKFAERKQVIDRESFLVFYFVLAVFCAGSGSLLGLDDLLIGFSCGVGFSNDGWFTEKTEESHVSNVIDLLLNLAYFVYFGSIIPWQDYSNEAIGLSPWRLVVIAILVIFFRRLPIMLLLKAFIPDVKTWREALFAGHFGPIGVGAIFASILARAELETNTTEPLPQSQLPTPGMKNYYIVQLIWPITTFMVISSILVHGSSIAVFTLGKHINTLTITLSYTTANDEGPSWMNRLPRVQSLAKSSMSFRKPDELEASSDEKLPEYPPGTLPPIGLPGNFLRRVQEDDGDVQSMDSASRKPLRRRRRKRHAAGGPISQSAIAPQRRSEAELDEEKKELEERDQVERENAPPTAERDRYGREPEMEVYQEGHHMIMEDEEGNVLKTEDTSNMSPEEQKQEIEQQRRRLEQDKSGTLAPSRSRQHEKTEGEDIQHAVGEKMGHPYEKARKRWASWTGRGGKDREKDKADEDAHKAEPATKDKPRSAHAYQFGNTIIVEDEDGEVIKKYTIPTSEKAKAEPKPGPSQAPIRRGITRMGTWFGTVDEAGGEPSEAAPKKKAIHKAEEEDWAKDDGLRFTVAQSQDVSKHGIGHGGRRMNKQEFFEQIKGLDAKARRDLVQQTDAPAHIQEVAQDEAQKEEKQERRLSAAAALAATSTAVPEEAAEELESESVTDSVASVDDLDEDDDRENDNTRSPSVAASLARFTRGTSAQERRSHISPAPPRRRTRRDSEDDGTERIPPSRLREAAGLGVPPHQAEDDTGETPAERRRRLAALGEIEADESDSDDAAVVDSDSDDNGEPLQVPAKVQFADSVRPRERSSPSAGQSSSSAWALASASASTSASTSGPAFASEPSSSSNWVRRHRPRVSWGGEKGRDS